MHVCECVCGYHLCLSLQYSLVCADGCIGVSTQALCVIMIQYFGSIVPHKTMAILCHLLSLSMIARWLLIRFHFCTWDITIMFMTLLAFWSVFKSSLFLIHLILNTHSMKVIIICLTTPIRTHTQPHWHINVLYPTHYWTNAVNTIPSAGSAAECSLVFWHVYHLFPLGLSRSVLLVSQLLSCFTSRLLLASLLRCYPVEMFGPPNMWVT